MRRHLKPTNKSWRVDETDVRVTDRWCYLYQPIDSNEALAGGSLRRAWKSPGIERKKPPQKEKGDGD